MADYNGKVKTLAAVDNCVNVTNCTNFGCMAIDGLKAWGVKTNSDDIHSMVYYSSNVNDKVSLTYPVQEDLIGHGNGMTCNSKYLLFACGKKKQIVRVPRGFKGDWSKKVIISASEDIPTIAYYKSYHYIVKRKEDKKNQRICYGVGKVTIDGNKGKFDFLDGNDFYVKTNWTYAHAQDIFYLRSKGLLFQPLNDSTLAINKILVYNLNGSYETYNGCKMFSPQDVITVNKSGTHEKYEVESLGIDAEGYIVMACNIKLNGASKETDSFQRITNVQY